MAPLDVFVVEDDGDVREMLVEYFAARGCSARGAGTVEESLRTLRQRPADVVLADLTLPGASGLWLLNHLAERGDATPVVLMTGHASVASCVEAFRAGAADYLAKPFASLASVYHAVRRAALRSHPLEPALLQRVQNGEKDAIREVFVRICGSERVEGWRLQPTGWTTLSQLEGTLGTAELEALSSRAAPAGVLVLEAARVDTRVNEGCAVVVRTRADLVVAFSPHAPTRWSPEARSLLWLAAASLR